jgi:hypothetical protein
VKWSDASFKALQQAWYLRLHEEGFEDAEELIAGELVLKQIAAHVYRNSDNLSRETKETYYRSIASFVSETAFKRDVDRIILTRYAEGKSIKAIVEELRAIGKPRCRNTVTIRIRVYEMKWGLKSYTQRQLYRYGKVS